MQIKHMTYLKSKNQVDALRESREVHSSIVRRAYCLP